MLEATRVANVSEEPAKIRVVGHLPVAQPLQMVHVLDKLLWKTAAERLATHSLLHGVRCNDISSGVAPTLLGPWK